MWSRAVAVGREALRTAREFLLPAVVFCVVLVVATWTWPDVLSWARARLGARVQPLVDGLAGWGPFGVAAAAFTFAGLLRRWWTRRRRLRTLRSNAPDLGHVNLVDRPAEMSALVRELRSGDGTTVGMTTALQGAGGFGKTTLATMVGLDKDVLGHFGGRIAWVTVGRDVGAKAILAKVHKAIWQIAPDKEAEAIVKRSTEVRWAGAELADLLNSQPRWLLILDDVWDVSQLDPFSIGGRHCVRLVTTRDGNLLRGRGKSVVVDEMTPSEARKLLLSGLPDIPSEVLAALLRVTGQWPLLLNLANKILQDAHNTGADVAEAARTLHDRLREGGPAIVDPLSRVNVDSIDLDDPEQRNRAVEATMRASLDLLPTSGDAKRLEELAVLAEDEAVPIALVAQFWQKTGGLDEFDTRQLCAGLARLGLVGLDEADGGKVTMHDVIRDYLRAKAGEAELRRLHGVFLDAVNASIPTRGPERG